MKHLTEIAATPIKSHLGPPFPSHRRPVSPPPSRCRPPSGAIDIFLLGQPSSPSIARQASRPPF